MNLVDYHVHSKYSSDSNVELLAYVNSAKDKGISEICITDHIDLHFPGNLNFELDVKSQVEAIRAKTYANVILKAGAEFGFREEIEVIKEQEQAVKNANYDFLIGSVHLVEGQDPWFAQYFDGKTRQEGFVKYLQTINKCMRLTSFFDAVGHIDYPTKGCPYEQKGLLYSDAGDLIDQIFTYVIQAGKCIEVNTSVQKKLNCLPDIEVYKRYVGLGGEFVTLGSDCHEANSLGYRFLETIDFLQEAGIKYVAKYSKREPIMMSFGELLK